MKTEHIIGGLILAVLAYQAGKNKSAQLAAQVPYNAVNTPADWWTFAGMWNT
ncbi:hypothetical protein ACQ86G_21525 [Roseateles chitinivorans]|uniref:hypothetical protein n=1 Tax=Roseateles chitinivorans TaxID=2917965 RepID=UPI003D66DABB